MHQSTGNLHHDHASAWPTKHHTLGVGVSGTTYADIVGRVMDNALRRQPGIVDFMPVSLLTEASLDAGFRAKLNDFDAVCPDGQPIRWCLNSFHKLGLRDTVCGTTTTLHLCEAAARQGVGIYLYGSTPATLHKLQTALQQRFPTLQIVGAESPPFAPPSPDELRAVAARFNASGAGLVFLGLGSPKQEHFAWAQREHVRAVQLCVGAAFDFIAGTKTRAPRVMQRLGLEWLHRLASEPRRLGRRYVVGNIRFGVLLLRHLWQRSTRGAVADA